MSKAKSGGKKALIIILIVILALGVVIATFPLVSLMGNGANTKHAQSLNAIQTDNTPLKAPYIDDETGYYTFECDRDFKVLHLTDVHIGGGCLAMRKDSMAIDAVYEMVKMTKPDLIIITGDMAYPVPFQSGTFNNKNAAKIFAEMMESIGVYWAIAFGNHDTEAYAFYDRDEIAAFYSEIAQKEGSHCLFHERPEDKDIDGACNYFINVKNSAGVITQSLIMFDSHSYAKGFYQDYDNIHENQVEWYEREIKRLDEINRKNGATEIIKSMAFFHIPLVEMKDAYTEWINAGKNDTANVKYVYGNDGEGKKVVYCGIGEDNVFEKMLELGSTQAIYFGHDHYNNFSLLYNGGHGDKYIRMTYGMSIDYLAYFGIVKQTAQRGGTVIEIASNGSYVSYAKRMIDGKEYRDTNDFEEINNWTGQQN